MFVFDAPIAKSEFCFRVLFYKSVIFDQKLS